MANISHPIPTSVTGISFSFLSSDDIRRISVKQIINSVLLDNLNQPNIGGLYDPALGPSSRSDICSTCELSYFTCPGHFGHIELPAPVFHPLFMSNMYHLLKCVCLFCHRFKISRTVLHKYIVKLRLLEHGLAEAAQGVDDIHMSVSSRPRADTQAKKKGKNKADTGDASSEDEAMALPSRDQDDETPDQYIMRLELYCKLQLRLAPQTNRDNYKDGIVYQMRREVISDFLKSTVLRKCQNPDCGSPAYTFRKEGHTKIVEYDLSTKDKSRLIRKRPDVLKLQQMSSYAKSHSIPSDDMDVDDDIEDVDEDYEDEDEDEGDDTNSAIGGAPRAISGRVKTSRGRNERLMAAEECRAHLRLLFEREPVACALIFGRHGPFAPLTPHDLSMASADIFFMDVIAVPPTRFRPPAKLGEQLFEHPQNEMLSKVLVTCYRLRDSNIALRDASAKKEGFNEATRKKVMGTLFDTLIQLQIDVNSFMDSSKNPAPMRQGKAPPAGVKQGLEKKEGLFRKHMMGKRVNYAARSVISPDPNIEPHEIGIPPVFAQKLTYPEPVTPFNVHELRQRVIAGPAQYPGATMIEHEDGTQELLSKATLERRTALANQLLKPSENHSTANRRLSTRTTSVNKKVYRHLEDGDILILNRQPTLHKPSMMCHFARVLRGEKTIRMHYVNCNSYNADFDGDEMNIHFPQSEIARAEATMIANTNNQYLVPTSGNPLRGLIQDHVVAGVWMTCQETFFEREEYFQLLYGAIRPEDSGESGSRLKTLPPAIWKPKALWTGKQLISTILRNITPEHIKGINLNSKTKVEGRLWGPDSKEDQVIFRDGELLCGVLDKAAFGASDYGLVHSVYELYGPDVAGTLLGSLSRLFTKFLQHRAFTCRVDDLTLTPSGNMGRAQKLQEAKDIGTLSAIDNFPSLKDIPDEELPAALNGLLRDILRDEQKMAGLDMSYRNRLSKLTGSIADSSMPAGLSRQFPHNHMQMMTLSGAKGSTVNARHISCGLGQQELEGRRVPVMVSGKTLPCYRPFETKAIAGGYVASRYLTGIKAQEFYYACMAGREGLIDTAVKTSRSGYLQRCLIKHLEGVRVHYDNTVRGSDSAIYQFHYGGDSLDVTKQKYLHQFAFIAQNENSMIYRLDPKKVRQVVDNDSAIDHMKSIVKLMKGSKDSNLATKREIDTTLSLYNPTRYLGSTSEDFAASIDEYVRKNPDMLIEPRSSKKKSSNWSRSTPLITSRNFRFLMNLKYMRSLVEPGEAVGLVASQGIGEPSTQMTLNTFHLAGHGAANVTLGIPRLREIVMTAARKPKTPSMILKVQPGTSHADIDNFCRKASRVTLSQIVESVTVHEELVLNGDARHMQLTVNLHFYPDKEYMKEYDVTFSNILTTFGTKFPLTLKKELVSEWKKLDVQLKSQIAELGKGTQSRDIPDGPTSGDEDDGDPKNPRGEDGDDSDDDDEDAEDEKRARQKKQNVSYNDADESDLEALDDAAIEAAFDEDSEVEQVKSKKKKSTHQHAATAKMFENNLPLASNFRCTSSKCTFQLSFTLDKPKLLFVGIVERACKSTVIREIPGITDCFKSASDDDSEVTLTTNGSNIPGLWQFASSGDDTILIDEETYSNDVFAILKTYGVEMARAAIIKEMSNVFGVYKIDVNRRHLELIADYMTFDGGYKPFNRKGISTHSSPLLKASFETTAAFISDATLYGDFDDLTSPSGNIVLGRPNKTGTNVFDVVMKT